MVFLCPATLLPVSGIPEPDSPPKSTGASSGEAAFVAISPRRQNGHVSSQQDIF